MDNQGVTAIRFDGQRLHLLDQRLLPAREEWLAVDDCRTAARAIADLVVRGAPAIGITAAYAAVLAARERGTDTAGWRRDLEDLAAARPTAINLAWAVRRMAGLVSDDLPGALATLEATARTIHADDVAANKSMAGLGAKQIAPGSGVLTHCNTGSLATGGVGTALGVIVRAWNDGRLREVFAGETRPWLQGSRLTAWELDREDVPCKVIVEGAAAGLMASGRVDWVITGGDRIAANGDVANKVGTLMLAVLARHFGARMMVVAPTSTVDPHMPDGSGVEIEQRDPGEVWRAAGLDGPPGRAGSWNPVFDITPADLVDCIVTEQGVLEPPFAPAIAGLQAA